MPGPRSPFIDSTSSTMHCAVLQMYGLLKILIWAVSSMLYFRKNHFQKH